MLASFQSAHTLPAANHPNSVNDVEAGDIIPGMPKHKINANITYSLFDGLNINAGGLFSSSNKSSYEALPVNNL